jgi:hypothetical protein
VEKLNGSDTIEVVSRERQNNQKDKKKKKRNLDEISAYDTFS